MSTPLPPGHTRMSRALNATPEERDRLVEIAVELGSAPPLSPAERARLDAWEAREAAPEGWEQRVERAARAIYEQGEPDYTEGGELIPWDRWSEKTHGHYRRLAAVALHEDDGLSQPTAGEGDPARVRQSIVEGEREIASGKPFVTLEAALHADAERPLDGRIAADEQCPITGRRCDRPCGTACIRGMFHPTAGEGRPAMTAPVPDPRFRDQLAEASTAVGDMAEDWWCPKREGVRRTECRYCIAEFAVDALLPLVEARVQAAANQRAAEELREAARTMPVQDHEMGYAIRNGLEPGPVAWLTARAAALAQPAPSEAER